MKLRQTLYNWRWDGGPKQQFDWSIEGSPATDSTGQYARIGSFGAKYWFHVAAGKTEKLTLSYAKRHLQSSTGYPSTFEYIEN